MGMDIQDIAQLLAQGWSEEAIADVYYSYIEDPYDRRYSRNIGEFRTLAIQARALWDEVERVRQSQQSIVDFGGQEEINVVRRERMLDYGITDQQIDAEIAKFGEPSSVPKTPSTRPRSINPGWSGDDLSGPFPPQAIFNINKDNLGLTDKDYQRPGGQIQARTTQGKFATFISQENVSLLAVKAKDYLVKNLVEQLAKSKYPQDQSRTLLKSLENAIVTPIVNGKDFQIQIELADYTRPARTWDVRKKKKLSTRFVERNPPSTRQYGPIFIYGRSAVTGTGPNGLRFLGRSSASGQRSIINVRTVAPAMPRPIIWTDDQMKDLANWFASSIARYMENNSAELI